MKQNLDALVLDAEKDENPKPDNFNLNQCIGKLFAEQLSSCKLHPKGNLKPFLPVIGVCFAVQFGLLHCYCVAAF